MGYHANHIFSTLQKVFPAASAPRYPMLPPGIIWKLQFTCIAQMDFHSSNFLYTADYGAGWEAQFHQWFSIYILLNLDFYTPQSTSNLISLRCGSASFIFPIIRGSMSKLTWRHLVSMHLEVRIFHRCSSTMRSHSASKIIHRDCRRIQSTKHLIMGDSNHPVVVPISI